MPYTIAVPAEVKRHSVPVPLYINVYDVSNAIDVTIPAGINWVLISATPVTEGIWICATGSAVTNTPAVDGTGSFYVPSSIEMGIGYPDVLSVVAHSSSGYISVGFYSD